MPRAFRLTLGALGLVQAAWAGAFAYGLTVRLEAQDRDVPPERARLREAAVERAQGIAERVFAPGTHREAVRITRLIAAEQPLVRLTLVGSDPTGTGPVALLASNTDGTGWQALSAVASSPPPGAEGGLMRWQTEPPRLSLLMTRTLRAPTPSPRPSPEAAPVVSPRVHVVRSGDTLYRISRQHYGHPGMHDAIWRENQDRLTDRTRLVAGMRLVLPVEPTDAPPSPPLPEPVPAVAAVGHLALQVEVPTPSEVLPGHQGGRAPWVGLSAAAGALGWWWLGAHLLLRRRRRDLLATRAGLQGLVAGLLGRGAGPWSPELVRSPWHVELAEARWEDPGGGFGLTDWRVLGPGCLGALLFAAEGPALPGLVARGQARLLWRALASEGVSPDRTLAELERRLRAEGVAVAWRACYVRIDVQSGEVSYATAGFAGLYLLGRGGGLTRLTADAEEGAAAPVPGRYAMAEGETLLLVTEALVGVENDEGEPFGLERLRRVLRERPGVSAEEVVATVGAALAGFSGLDSHAADVAMLGVRLANRHVAGGRGA